MIPYQRRNRIVEEIQRKKTCSVAELSELFKVSEITIHRDLAGLEQKGMIKRVHGGAVLVEEAQDDVNGKVDQRINVRLQRNVVEKREIAKKAVRLIRDDTSIFIDHSSTSIYLAWELKTLNYHRLVVVTNSVRMLSELEEVPWITLISTGGAFLHQWSAFSGPLVLDVLSKLNFDQFFVSCGAVSIEKGTMTSFIFISEILKKVCEVSREVNLLVDSSKFSKVGTFSVMPVTSVKRIITDQRLDPMLAKEYSKLGVELIV